MTRPCQQAARSLTAAARAAVVFGRVVEGMKLVRKLETMGTQSGKPRQRVVITDCGEVSLEHSCCLICCLICTCSRAGLLIQLPARPAAVLCLGRRLCLHSTPQARTARLVVLLFLMASPPPCLSWAAPLRLEATQQRPPAAAPIPPDCHTLPVSRPSPMSAPSLYHTATPAQLSGRGSPFTVKLWPWTDTSSFSRLILVPVPAAAPQSAPDPGKTGGRETDAGGPQEEPCSCGP